MSKCKSAHSTDGQASTVLTAGIAVNLAAWVRVVLAPGFIIAVLCAIRGWRQRWLAVIILNVWLLLHRHVERAVGASTLAAGITAHASFLSEVA